ncbi:hypothetical protein [Pectobacterium versatile]|uniref:hypothetical protein n=1 Tax=Pectobacterium versatile TaxID=2488639 RepID=UPI00102E6873|nr:hypothetical protein [Pectobacterium versatile]TAI99829.1 hypothetical protein EG332_04290 [Pectobacterium versatile]UEQ10484.1 hypothetical protein LLE50_05065 [Pectobacterium versatile]GKX40312.1 hypothetical protein SOASR014_40510 [Pectobacterium carotovorum subsp. carotovorum]GLX46415.1 hypothetical protein Pcaca01_40830 [Pectobacterium carotovorum subsp. carotovorum]
MSKETGGQAFPIPGSQRNYPMEGMTLRDYFAAKAMQGITSHDDSWGLNSVEKIAVTSYEIADAMIKAREN